MDLLTAVVDLFVALWGLLAALGSALLPWAPLLCWIAFWMLAVDWKKLRTTQLEGGVIGLVLLGLMAVLVWGVIAPPEGGRHSLLGLQVSNFTGKLIYVTALIVIMQLCGAVQLSGACDRLLNLASPLGSSDHGHDDHGHDQHGHGQGGHGHDGRGHDDHAHSHGAHAQSHGDNGHH